MPLGAAPVVVFAVDGFEWDVLLPLLKAGKLPNLVQLMERGCYGELETFEPTLSPVVWTTVATGKHHSKHGIKHFVVTSEGGAKVRLNTSQDRKTKAIWNILSDHGRSVASIGWWLTFPVESINGVMVAQTNTTEQLDPRGGKHVMKGVLRPGMSHQVFPPGQHARMFETLREVESILPDLSRTLFGDFRHPLQLLDERLWNNCQWSFRADATYLRIAIQQLAENPDTDLSLVYFGGPDVVGHRFWRYMQPDNFRHRPTDQQLENFASIIEDYYIYTDQSLGRLLEACPSNTTMLVISDHGMGPINQNALFNPDDPPKDVNSGHHFDSPPGVFFAAGPCIRKTAVDKTVDQLTRDDLALIGSVTDITPTILAMLRIPLGEDMDGRVLKHIFRDEFRIEQQPPAVRSHDTSGFLASRSVTAEPHPAEAERLQQLRSLGYVGEDEESNGR